MKTLHLLLLTIVLTLSTFTLKATHYMGGEITWACIPFGQPNAGKFVFTLKVYRECYTSNGNSAAQFGSTVVIQSNSPAGSISCSEIAGWPKDISPQCNSNPLFTHLVCTGMANGAGNMGAVQEHIYRSQPVQILGVPPASGWIFSWASCCRNSAANVPGQPSWYLRAIMYPYNNLNTSTCYDNSPTFAEIPRTVICTGYPFTYNHNAYDKELDSLAFSWGQPMESATAPLTYGLGYSYTNPLPGTTQNPNNVAGTVNPTTGTISFTSYTTGAYVTSTKVAAYKCGIKVAEIWRDMQVVLLSCGTNSPPTVTPPFNANTSFVDTVYAGELVSFSINAQDLAFLPNGSPQTMSISASGSMFGTFIPPTGTAQATMSTTAGCLNPPCAKLTPAPGPLPTYALSGVFGIQTQFSWLTDCEHLATNIGCGSTSNVYNFVFKVSDDYCPAPAIAVSTVTIVVLPKPTIPSPPIQCIKVQPNGDVIFNWSVQVDTMNTFSNNKIYSSNSPTGPFVLIDSLLNININTYQHVGANANNGPVYYRVGTEAGCPGHTLLSNADTTSTIHLSVINTMLGTAQLNWNPPSTPLLSTSSGVYDIYREYPAGNWTWIGSTTSTSFTDSITACGNIVNYRIEIADSALKDSTGFVSTCYSVSNVDGDMFSDIIPPNIPMLDSVSVNSTTGFADMAWDISHNGDTKGYIIYLLDNTTMLWHPIDTVYGRLTNTYSDQNNNPCNPNGSYNTYAIAAIDSCGNTSLWGTPQNTMNLKAVKDICDDKITLTWNSYNNMPGGLGDYEVWVSENNGPATVLANVLPIDTTFEHIGLTNNSTYCYSIRARGVLGNSSTSCTVCEVANKPNQPQFIYIRSASVIPGNILGVQLTLHCDTAGKVSLYRIERQNTAGTWVSIATLPPNYTNPTLTYVDGSALVAQKAYRYRVIVIDSCGDDVLTSNIARTMYLTVEANDSLFNRVKWNPYFGFDGTPTTYNLYRSLDGVWSPTPIISLPSTQTIYVDDVSFLEGSSGVFEYFAIAIEGAFNTYNFIDSALSNSAIALQKPRLYVPSAFNPSSSNAENRVFFPVGVYVNSTDYLFMVFNRWGQKVFETTEINHGWDGKFEGIDAPEDVYTYFVRFTTSRGYLYEDRGTTTLIR